MVPISYHLIDDMVRVGWKVEYGITCECGIPKDAVLVGSFTGEMEQTGFLVYEHESFDEVPIGVSIPMHRVIYHQEYRSDRQADEE